MPKLIPIVLAALLLGACQQMPVTDENSPSMRVQPGSRIILHEALTVPAGHARVFLQGGKVVAKTKLKRYHPHCNFEVRQVSDGSLRIEPDTFLVTDVVTDEEEWVSREWPLRVAGWEMSGGALDGPMMVTRLVHHRLDSPRQPQVMRLTCHGGFAEAWKVRYPSVSEIRRSLGQRATLELAASGG
jgi:hypothetical protein